MAQRRILVVAPVWPNVSELWMHRMTALLADETVGFATFAPKNPFIAETVPTSDLLLRLARPLARWNITSFGYGIGSGKLMQLIRSTRATHILCHYATTAVHFRNVWAKVDLPVWTHCHGYDVTWTRGKMTGLPMAQYKEELRQLAQRVRFLANSQFTKDRLIQADLPEDRIFVKYIGVPVNESNPLPKPSRSHVEILFLGRLIDFKGPLETIQAFEKALETGRFDGRLTIAGDGPLQSECEALVMKSPYRDKIRMVGTVSAEQGEALRQECDLFTAHSCLGGKSGQAEAYGVAFVEAMFAGLPVVTGRYGGVCETVVDGETGILFEPGDIEAHAECLASLACNPALRSKLGQAGRERAKECFSLEKEKSDLSRLLNLL
jgi:glycosyltransferase involved in cell wall biosynthesis